MLPVGLEQVPLSLPSRCVGVLCQGFLSLQAFKVRFEAGFLLNPGFWEITESGRSLQWNNHQWCW